MNKKTHSEIRSRTAGSCLNGKLGKVFVLSALALAVGACSAPKKNEEAPKPIVLKIKKPLIVNEAYELEFRTSTEEAVRSTNLESDKLRFEARQAMKFGKNGFKEPKIASTQGGFGAEGEIPGRPVPVESDDQLQYMANIELEGGAAKYERAQQPVLVAAYERKGGSFYSERAEEAKKKRDEAIKLLEEKQALARFEMEERLRKQREEDEARRLAELESMHPTSKRSPDRMVLKQYIVRFPFGSSNLTSEQRSVLVEALMAVSKEAAKVSTDPKEIYWDLTGHTDNVGSEKSNEKLGLKRAGAVKSFLVDAGAREDRIHVDSKGETEPLEKNTTAAGRAANRRVHVVIEEDKPKLGLKSENPDPNLARPIAIIPDAKPSGELSTTPVNQGKPNEAVSNFLKRISEAVEQSEQRLNSDGGTPSVGIRSPESPSNMIDLGEEE